MAGKLRAMLAQRWLLFRLDLSSLMCLLAVDVINASNEVYPGSANIAYRSIAKTIGAASKPGKPRILYLHVSPERRRMQMARWN